MSDPEPAQPKPDYPPKDNAPLELPNGGIVQTTEAKDLQLAEEKGS